MRWSTETIVCLRMVYATIKIMIAATNHHLWPQKRSKSILKTIHKPKSSIAELNLNKQIIEEALYDSKIRTSRRWLTLELNFCLLLAKRILSLRTPLSTAFANSQLLTVPPQKGHPYPVHWSKLTPITRIKIMKFIISLLCMKIRNRSEIIAIKRHLCFQRFQSIEIKKKMFVWLMKHSSKKLFRTLIAWLTRSMKAFLTHRQISIWLRVHSQIQKSLTCIEPNWSIGLLRCLKHSSAVIKHSFWVLVFLTDTYTQWRIVLISQSHFLIST